MNEIALEYDNRPLAYRVGVLKDDGTEGSIPTIGKAHSVFEFRIEGLASNTRMAISFRYARRRSFRIHARKYQDGDGLV
jgi:hypothetical protein